MLESSIVIGTAEHPLFNQPAHLWSATPRRFGKVIDDLETVFTAYYRPVQPWPPYHERLAMSFALDETGQERFLICRRVRGCSSRPGRTMA